MHGWDSLARILSQYLDQDAEPQAGAFIHLQPTETGEMLYKFSPTALGRGRGVSPAPAFLFFPITFPPICHDVPRAVTTQDSLVPSLVRMRSPRGALWHWTPAAWKWAGSRYKCSCNHIIAYTTIVLHCGIRKFFHIKCRRQTQSLLYLLTHFIKFTSFLLCLCTSVPSAVCTKSYWHFNIKLLWQEDIPLAK